MSILEYLAESPDKISPSVQSLTLVLGFILAMVVVHALFSLAEALLRLIAIIFRGYPPNEDDTNEDEDGSDKE